ncbi:MAG: hypothetical protein AAF517_25610 [Planctomycetota bacterium]
MNRRLLGLVLVATLSACASSSDLMKEQLDGAGNYRRFGWTAGGESDRVAIDALREKGVDCFERRGSVARVLWVEESQVDLAFTVSLLSMKNTSFRLYNPPLQSLRESYIEVLLANGEYREDSDRSLDHWLVREVGEFRRIGKLNEFEGAAIQRLRESGLRCLRGEGFHEIDLWVDPEHVDSAVAVCSELGEDLVSLDEEPFQTFRIYWLRDDAVAADSLH